MGKGRGRPKKIPVAATPPAAQRGSTPQSSLRGSLLDKLTDTLGTTGESNSPKAAKLPPIIEVQQIETEKTAKDTTWVDVIKGNRLPTNGIGLDYTPPMVVNGDIEVVIEAEDVASETIYWENALIMYVLGGNLTMNGVKNFMMRVWNFAALPELYYNEEGFFIIRFQSKEDKESVLKRGPYSIFRQPMFLHEWSPNFSLSEDAIRLVPIWVMLPQLPLTFWGEKSIGKIGSALGTPLMADECTTKKLRISYARLLVEIDITVPLKDSIIIKGPDGVRFTQQVHYEWQPVYCMKCSKLGHDCEKQKKPNVQGKKIWAPKPPQQKTNNNPETTGVQQDPIVVAVESPWTVVGASRHRGKSIVEDESKGPNVEIIGTSKNGFEVLGQDTHLMGDPC
ncbi:uncharacterized protein LOC131649739 [Vicia villosa]|uniref:uncharacterized protein LOC131649739 n=1 Tax=Vicia villosa TaxID=3911 RepID=UPI00273B6436|nr:uncharacterized protein LOC131649739 [Vicia villosa]